MYITTLILMIMNNDASDEDEGIVENENPNVP